MSQSLQVLPTVARAIPAAGTPGASAENPDSGPSFESALAGQLTGSEVPAGESAAVGNAAAAVATPDAGASTAADLAASGKALPPPLPPVAVDPAVLAIDGAGMVAESLAGTSTAPASTVTDDPQQDVSAAPLALVDVLAVTAPLAAVPVAVQAPAALPTQQGQSGSASVESALNRPEAASTATRSAAVDAQTLAALSAAATTAEAVTAKSADVPPSLEVFRSVLKEIAPTAADARPVLAAPPAVSTPLTAGSFASPMAGSPTPGAAVASAAITVPFGQAGWGQAFGNQVVWAVNQNMPAAELHLSPPDLGPMSVRISMDQDQASMAFSSPHAMVREAIEAALPRLRDMLGSQGITLADVNVSQHGAADAQRDPGEWRNGSSGGNAGSAQANMPGAANTTRSAVGMLDVYV